MGTSLFVRVLTVISVPKQAQAAGENGRMACFASQSDRPYQQKKSKRPANIGRRADPAPRTQVNTLDETSRPRATLGTNYTILGADHHLLGWGETGDFRRLITFIILNLRLWRNASSASLAIIVSEDRAQSQI